MRSKLTDGREGVVFFGADPDHHTPMRIINKFIGEDVLEINGGGFAGIKARPMAKISFI